MPTFTLMHWLLAPRWPMAALFWIAVLAPSAFAQQACDTVSDCQVFPQWEAACVSNQCQYTCGAEEGEGCGPDWVEYVTSFQRNVIGIDEPVNWVTRIGSHNASASRFYGSLLDPNQSLSITGQLEAGARILAIDLHVLDGDLYLCHNDLCFENRERFADIMEEIGLWLDTNPEEFLWITIEYLPYQSCELLPDTECQDASLSFEDIQDTLEDGIQNGLGADRVYRPSDDILAPDDGSGLDRYVHPEFTAYYCSVSGNACENDNSLCPSGETCELAYPSGSGQTRVRRWATLRELRREGKQVLLTMGGTGGCCGDDCGVYTQGVGFCSLHSTADTAGQACTDNDDCIGLANTLSWVWEDGGLGGVYTSAVSDVSKDFDYQTCTTSDGDLVWDPDSNATAFSVVGEARTLVDAAADTSGFIEEGDVAVLMECNPSRISLDFIDRAEDTAPSACAAYIDCEFDVFGLSDVIPGGLGCFVASCPVDDTRILRSAWSWKWGVRPNDEAPRDTRVFMNGIDGRWNPTDVGNQPLFRCACGNRRTGEPADWTDPRGDVWEVTSRGAGFNPTPESDDRDAGQLCQLACQAEHSLDFGIPVSGYQNRRLYDALIDASEREGTELSQENAWLRLSRDATTGPWTTDIDPWISSLQALADPTEPGFRDIEAIVENPDGFNTAMIFIGDDGISSDFLDPVSTVGTQQTFEWSKPFASEGEVEVAAELWGNPDPQDTVLSRLDSETLSVDFEFPNTPPEIESLDFLDRSLLTPICADVCIGHLLELPGFFTDPDDADPFQVRVLYGDADDSSCLKPSGSSEGVCTGASNGTRSCTRNTDCGVIVPFTAESTGFYAFEMTNLYAESGVFNGVIVVDDGTDETEFPFVVENLDPVVGPEIGGGCANTLDPLAVGDNFTCSPTFSDLNVEDTHTVEVDYNDGTVEELTVLEINSTSKFVIIDHQFTAPGTFNVKLTVTDSGGLSDSTVYIVEVEEELPVTPPTVQMVAEDGTIIEGPLFPELSGTEGEPVRRTFRIIDETPEHDKWQLVIAWGDLVSEGSVVVNETYGGLTRNADGNIQVNTSHVYPCEFGCGSRSTGAFGVHVFARAVLGGTEFGPYSAAATFTVNIDSDNTAPQLDGLMTADGEVDEGSLFSRPGQSFSDPDDSDGWVVYVDWGDGGIEEPALSGQSFDLTHTYQDNGVYAVQVIVTDGTDTDSRAFNVVVNNVAPAPDAGDDLSVEVGETVGLSGTWTDPAGNLDAPYAWRWSVGGVEESSGTANFGEAVPFSTVFTTPGSRLLEFRVTDKDGGSGSASLTVQVGGGSPVAEAGADQTLECTAPSGTPATVDGTASSDPFGRALDYLWTSDAFGSSNAAVVTAPFPLGDTIATLVVTNSDGISDDDSVLVRIQDTVAPDLTAPGDVVVECTSPDANEVVIGEPAVNDACDAAVVVTNDAPAVFPTGSTVVQWTATDASGNFATADQQVSVVDTTSPTVRAAASPASLWPPNHSLVPVTINVSAEDVCDAAPVCSIASVSSNEAGNDKGDGNTEPDWIVDGDLSLRLRAERSGKGSGRTYTIDVVCEDASGAIGQSSTTVRVEKNR